MSDKKNQANDSTLVTLAIKTLANAQELKDELEKVAIVAELHAVNPDASEPQGYARVRIRQKDLSKALKLVEKDEEKQRKSDGSTDEKYVLIPVDFSEYSRQICRLGVHFAARRGLSVVLFHVYYSPFFLPPMIIGDSMSIQTSNNVKMHFELDNATMEMNRLKVELEEEMLNGALPRVEYRSVLRYGSPEDVILSYSKRHPPVIIVMGTRGKGEHGSDLIGSVAAEVIDAANVPVFVVPAEVPFDDFMKAKHVAIATNFEERDLILFKEYYKLALDFFTPKYHVFNTSHFSPEWTSVQLKAVENYFTTVFPNLDMDYSLLEMGDFDQALEKFLKEKQIDVIVVNTYRRGFFSKLLKPSIARKMLFYSGTPLLVMHA